MSEDAWLVVVAVAERHGCSTKTVRRRIRQGDLAARTEKVGGRDGRPVINNLTRSRTWTTRSARRCTTSTSGGSTRPRRR